MKNIFKNYSINDLKTRIRKYGFNYSTKDFIIEATGIILLVFVVALISRLKLQYILLLVLEAMAIIPFLIHAWFAQNYNIKKFKMLTDYLGNIIPIFIQKAKIRYTLGELFEITNDQMKETIGKAINYLDNTTNDPQVSKNALRIIENDFPNSRVKSVHKLLLTVEAQNSIVYEDVCQNMYEDIEKWIKRVYTFQKDLKNRRTKLLALCITTLFMNSIFVYLYVSNEYFIGFTENIVYQISTLIFITFILLAITAILTRLNGEWLINDTEYYKDEKLKKWYLIYKKKETKPKLVDILTALMCLVGSIYLFVSKRYIYIFITMLLCILALFNKKRIYKRAYKIINKALTVEFPVWLREISLTLNNLTVLNAIEYSQNIASYPLRKEIRTFLNKAKIDPTSIKPYNEFLEEFDLEDAKSTMKVLYAIQSVGKEDVKKRVSNLIIRNQEMLDKAESIRNNDSIGGIEALGYVPIFLFTFQMLISMFSMFGYMMETISRNVSI